MSQNTSGTNPLPREIQSTQTQSSNFDASHIICNSNGSISIKGNPIIFDPPLPIDNTQIESQDQTSQVKCLDNSQIQITGEILGYSTTQQTNQNLSQAINDLSNIYLPLTTPLNQILVPDNNLDLNNQQIDNLSDPTDLQQAVNLQFLQNNYTDTINSQNYVDSEIALLDTVYQSINTTLDQIPVAENSLNLNNQLISNVLDPVSDQDCVTKNYLTTNYTNTTNSQQFVNQSIQDLSNVYQSINTTLDQIPAAQNSLDLNSQKITNLLPGVNQTDAVNISQLSGYLPTISNINSLNNQTANYSTQGFQIQNSTDPVINSDLTNKNYVDSQISNLSSVYYPKTYTLNQIAQPTFSMNFNGVRLTNIGTNNSSADAVRQDYLTTNYSTTTTNNNTYYSKTYTLNQIAVPTSSINMNSQNIQYLANPALPQDAVTLSYLQSFYQTISSMSNYYTGIFISQTFQSISAMSNYYNSLQIDSLISGLSSIYLSISSFNSQISSYVLQSSLVTQLSSYVLQSSLITQLLAYVKTSDLASYLTQIQSTSTQKSKVNCSSASQIVLTINDQDKGYFYQPTGQSSQPLGLLVNDKLQFQSNLNSFSFYGGKTLQNVPTQNYNSVYINSSDDITKNVGFQLSLGGTSNLTQECVLSTGHTLLNGNQVPYSALSNNSASPQYNMQISGGTPQNDQTLTLYSDYYAGILQYNLKAQFNKPVGYSQATNITENLQFTSKLYVDNLISGLSSIYLSITNAASTYLTQSSFATQISNYYTKTLSDARYYLNSVTLNNITAPNGNLSMANNRITNCLDPQNTQDVATKNYVDTQSGSGISLSTAKANFYSLDGTNTVLPSASLNMNSQNIINVSDPTTGQMCATKNYVDIRAPFQTGYCPIGIFATNNTTPIAITGNTGCIQSATKQLSYASAGTYQNIITINYNGLSTVPIIFCTFTYNQTAGSPSQAWNAWQYFVQSVTNTQAKIQVIANTASITGQITVPLYMNVLFVTGALA